MLNLQRYLTATYTALDFIFMLGSEMFRSVPVGLSVGRLVICLSRLFVWSASIALF